VHHGALAFLLGYCLGSIPFGMLLTRVAGTADLRTIGSGNIGATNVLRTGRKDLAALTLLLDLLKGTCAVVLARFLFPGGPESSMLRPELLAAVGAFLGHVFPVWLSLRGGKGVATFLGCLAGVAWPAALAFAAVWLSVAQLTRYSSASALFASALAPLVLLGTGSADAALVFALLAMLLWAKHRPNIERLLAGTESKIGQT
jgi:glycerol-3-phosphate acyltransferase PlsY